MEDTIPSSCASTEEINSVSDSDSNTETFQIYQHEKGKDDQKPQLFHACDTKPILSILSKLMKQLWSQTLRISSVQRIDANVRILMNVVMAPMEDVPVLFALTGTSSNDDCSRIFQLFKERFAPVNCICAAKFAKKGLHSQPYVIKIPNKCTTLHEILVYMTRALKKGKPSTIADKEKPLLKKKLWLMNFFLCFTMYTSTPVIVIVPHAETLSSNVLTTLIQLCYHIRLGPSSSFFYNDTNLPNQIAHATHTPFVPVALILGVSISTVDSIQQNWSPETILKTHSTSTHIFDVRGAVRYAADTVISHLYISSLLHISYSFLSTLIDDVHQFSRSLHYFQTYIELNLTVLLSLIPPRFLCVLIPVHLKFIQRPKTTLSSTAGLSEPSYFIADTTDESRCLCPHIELESDDAESLSVHVRQSLINVYTQLNKTCNNVTEVPKKSTTFKRSKQQKELKQSTDIVSNCILYFCSAWKHRYILSLVRFCFPQADPLVHLPFVAKNNGEFNTKDFLQWIREAINKVIVSSSLENPIEQFKQNLRLFLCRPETHWELYLAVHITELQEAQLGCVLPEKQSSLQKLKPLLSQFIENEINDMKSIEQILLQLADFSLTYQNYIYSFIPSATYCQAWKITTSLLSPYPMGSLKHCFEQHIVSSNARQSHLTTQEQTSCGMVSLVFLNDIFIFYGFLLQQETQSNTISLEIWFTLFVDVLLGKSTLAIQTKHTFPALVDSEETISNKSRKANLSHFPESSSKGVSSPCYFSLYGCLCNSCLWQRFLSCMDTFILLGFITIPHQSRKKKYHDSQNHLVKMHKSKDGVSDLNSYHKLLYGFECKKLYKPLEEIGFQHFTL